MININELRSMVNATQFESFANSVINSLLDRLEAAEKNVTLLERLIDARGSSLNAVANECDALRAKIEAAEKENTKLRKALAQKVTSETMLRDLSVGNGSINASFEGGAVHLFVDSLANQFVESGAVNYLEMRFHSEATGPLLLTLQRVNGKTPHQLRTEAEKERDILRAKIEQMEQQVPICRAEDLKHAESLLPTLGLKPENLLYGLPGAQEQEPTRDWWDCLIADISAIDCMYRGSPTYAHDAYWMRDHVVRMLEQRRDGLPGAQGEKDV